MVERKESKHDVVVRYRDGGEDRYYGVEIIGFKDGVLEIRESNSRRVYIVIDKLSWWTKEKGGD